MADRITKRTVFFTMLRHPDGWIRVGPAYSSRKEAQGWLSFVKQARRLRTGRVAQLTCRWVNGELDAKTIETLDKKFNMDPPAESEE